MHSSNYFSDPEYLTGFMSNSDTSIEKDSNAKSSSNLSVAAYLKYSCPTAKNKLLDRPKNHSCHVSDTKALCINSRVDKTTDSLMKSTVESTPLISKFTPTDSSKAGCTSGNQDDRFRFSVVQCDHPSVSSEGDVTIGDSDIVEELDNEIADSGQESATESLS